MIPILRPYQADAVERASQILRRKNSLLIVCPTAGGKTIVAAEIIRRAEALGNPCAFLAHRTELIDQSVDKLHRFGVVAGVIMANDPRYYPLAKTQVCSVPTLARRLKHEGTLAAGLKQGPPPAKLLIYDEAHHSLANSNKKIVEHYRKTYGAKIIGLTATPFRADGLGLGDLYEEQLLACRPEELIELGALVEYDAFAFHSPDLRDVRMTGGDYNAKDLSAVVEKTATRAGDIVGEYAARCPGRRAIVFPVDVADSKRLCEAFEQAGFRARHVDWSTPKSERKASLEAFDRGEVAILSSCGVLTEGFDSPRAEVCILARPTASLALHLQMIGRVLRVVPCACGLDYKPRSSACSCGVPWEKLRARVHDHSGNLLRHGLPDDPDRDYSMHATSQKVRAMKTCPSCKTVFSTLVAEDRGQRAAADAIARGDAAAMPVALPPGLERAVVARAFERKRLGTLELVSDDTPGLSRVCPNCGEVLAAPDTTGIGGGERPEIENVAYEEIFDKDAIRARRLGELDAKLRGHLTVDQVARADAAAPWVRKAEYARLLRVRDEKRYKTNWASLRFRATFGEWPKWKEPEMATVAPAAESFFPFETTRPEPPPADAPPPWLVL